MTTIQKYVAIIEKKHKIRILVQQHAPIFRQENQEKMSKQANLPSIATRNDEPGGEKSIVAKEKDTIIFSKEIDGIMELTRIENGQLNKVDYESLMDKTDKMMLNNKKDAKANRICTRYQNLCRAFVANNNIKEKYDDVALVRFLKSIQYRYSANTL